MFYIHFNAQTSPGFSSFLESFQSYQRASGGSTLVQQFMLLLLSVTFLFFVIWMIYRLLRGVFTLSRVSDFRKSSKKHLKDIALKKLISLQADTSQINVFFDMMGTSDDYAKAIEDHDTFERYLNNYYKNVKNPKKIEIAESLRDTFHLNFTNLKIPVSSTRMLPKKKSIRVYLTRGFKRVDYLSIVARNDAQHFAILPPKRNGVWVNIGNLKELEIRVYREKDGEYQFFCPIKWQSTQEVPLIYLGHTNKTIKIFSRNFKRYQLELPCSIARISEDNLKTTESARVMTKDISKGGVGLLVPKDLLIGPNDVLEISFADRKDFSTLYGRVSNYNIFDNSQQSLLNVEFTGITEVERLLIERFIDDKLNKQH